jgi:AraC-like DNA-binding protein
MVIMEYRWGKALQRKQNNTARLAKVARAKRPLITRLSGFNDFTVPILIQGRCVAVIMCGYFLTHAPTPESIRQGWKELSGREARPLDPDFNSYLQFTLSAPVFKAPALANLTRYLEVMAALMASESAPEPLLAKLERLGALICAQQPEPMWRVASLAMDPLTHSYARGLMAGLGPEKWRREPGDPYAPEIALAVMPLWEPYPEDEVELLVRGRAFQEASVRICRRMKGMFCGRLGGWGSLFLGSLPRDTGAVKARLALRDLAALVAREVRRETGAKAACGAGTVAQEAGDLPRSCVEAHRALQLGLQAGRELTFYGEEAAPGLDVRAVYAARRGLAEAFRGGDGARFQLASANFIRLVLLESGEREELMRFHFLAALDELLEILTGSTRLDAGALTSLTGLLQRQMGEMNAGHQLLLAFQQALRDMQGMLLSPGPAQSFLHLEDARRFLEANYRRRLRLADVARQAGLSPGAFSRAFKRQYGTGFGRMLLDLRLDKAGELLRGTRLKANQVAAETGFVSLTHFYNAFTKSRGMAPLAFRRKVAGS